jgi:hypothetical protein
MVAVRLARGWVGYGGLVHRPGDLVDVDAVTLAKLEASGVVTPSENTDRPADKDDERTVAWAGPTGDDGDERTVAWAGPTGDDEDDAGAGPDGRPRP